MALRLASDSIRVWARFIRVEQQLLDKVEDDLKASGLPPLVWYDVLLELTRSVGGRLRHKQLHARMLLAKYNLSRLIDRMTAEGLVTREPVDDDARGASINLSDAGRAMQKRMWPVYQRAISRHFARRLDRAETEALGEILGKLQSE